MTELTTKSGKIVPLIGLGTYPLQGEAMAKMAIEAFKKPNIAIAAPTTL